ncbi:UDP-2,4-diacetamido-2,4,6-trideoxy-beta-L-altropyranose hydrolase [Rubrivivax gelatinosus]|nr:UDP-2,4-diacetamido-2,4,6-trideoxy-beta-L-altropyranose hydrolase [Rubrivivax gelatinosus]
MARRIVFRADASLVIGSGHVMRNLTLADALRRRGHEPLFVCRAHPGHLIAQIRDRGFDVLELDTPCSPAQQTAQDPLPAHAAWLGTDWRSDAAQTVAVLGTRPCDLLVVDHYALDARWERAVACVAPRRMAVDDLADRAHDVDLLLDQNLGRTADDYAGRLASDPVLLIGPHYALLRPAFAQRREQALARRASAGLREVFVSLGGMDIHDTTSRILRALSSYRGPASLSITVLMGHTAPWLEQVRSVAATMPYPTRVLAGVSDPSEPMLQADLAIGAAGSTSWERCCLGLPTLMVVLAENQREAARHLVDAGAAIELDLDESFESRMLNEMLQLAGDPMRLAGMAASSAALVDGQGTARVCNSIETLWN